MRETKRAIQDREREEARETLRKMLPPGSTVYTVLRSVSRSGMSRSIDAYLIENGATHWLSHLIHKATGLGWDKARECLKMGGCGMDMGFAIVADLGYALYPDGFECIGDGGNGRSACCPSNDHSNDDRDYAPHLHKSGGYALNHRWL